MTDPSAFVAVRDHALWIAHIQGDAALSARLSALRAGEDIDLEIEGVRGTWRKMADGSDGRPSPGLRPVSDAARGHWHALQADRGRVVTIGTPAVATPAPDDAPPPDAFLIVCEDKGRTDQMLIAAPLSEGSAPLPGARVFVWFENTIGLASQGRVIAVDDGSPLAVLIRVEARPTASLIKADLEPVKADAADAINARLAHRLDRSAISPLSAEEAQFLTRYFEPRPSPSSTDENSPSRTEPVSDPLVTRLWKSVHEKASADFPVLGMMAPSGKGRNSNWIIFKANLPPRVTIDWKICKASVELSFWKGSTPQIPETTDLSPLATAGRRPAKFVLNGETRAIAVPVSPAPRDFWNLSDDAAREALSAAETLYRFYCNNAPWSQADS